MALMTDNNVELEWSEFLNEEVFTGYSKPDGGQELDFEDDMLLEPTTQSSGGDTDPEDLSFPADEQAMLQPMDIAKVKASNGRFVSPDQGSLLDPSGSFWKRVKVTIRESRKRAASSDANTTATKIRREHERLRPDRYRDGRTSAQDVEEDKPIECNTVSTDLYERLKLLMKSPQHERRPSRRSAVQLPEVGPVLQALRAAAARGQTPRQPAETDARSEVPCKEMPRAEGLTTAQH